MDRREKLVMKQKSQGAKKSKGKMVKGQKGSRGKMSKGAKWVMRHNVSGSK